MNINILKMNTMKTPKEVYEYAKENNLSFPVFLILLEDVDYKLIHNVSNHEVKLKMLSNKDGNEFEKL